MSCCKANICGIFSKKGILKDAVFFYALNILQLPKVTNKCVKLLIYPDTRYIGPEIPKSGNGGR
jgi:hypothetical protein